MNNAVNPKASPEAVALLKFLYEISGRKTIAGQHCVPLVGSMRLVVAQRVGGKYPGLFGQDFGFDQPGTWDGINYRQNIVDEAIKRHRDGFINTLMWHAVRPIEDEPVKFESSIQGKLSDSEWNEMITPGTRLHERWKSQVDVIAWHLKQLQYAKVPALWRPYHEMNGGWFWWGRKSGDNGYKKLWRMMFDRYTNFHGLDNLLWVYDCNEVREGNIDGYDVHYPGHDVVDVLATDVYRGGFAQSDYDGLSKVAAGKPIAIGECGGLPSVEILQSQPKWTWFMLWGEPGNRAGWGDFKQVYQSDLVTTLDQFPWSKQKTEPRMHYPVIG